MLRHDAHRPRQLKYAGLTSASLRFVNLSNSEESAVTRAKSKIEKQMFCKVQDEKFLLPDEGTLRWASDYVRKYFSHRCARNTYLASARNKTGRISAPFFLCHLHKIRNA